MNRLTENYPIDTMQKIYNLSLWVLFCFLGLVACTPYTGLAPTPNNIRVPFTSPEATIEPETLVPPVIDAEVSPTTQHPTATAFPQGLSDELPVMRGICFDGAYDAREQIFVLRSAEQHINFYDLADNSGLCSRPVDRYPFDFTTGNVLAGTWTYGIGCTAWHEIVSIERDDDAKQIAIQTKFHVNGDCNYELLRPFWVGIIGAQSYDIEIFVEK